MNRSREAGRNQMENHLSRPGDPRRYPPVVMWPKITIRRMLWGVLIFAILLGTATNWHSRSMKQYRALSASDPDDGIWVVEFNCELVVDSKTSNIRIADDVGFTSTVFQAWLCRFFDPYYACNCVVVFPSQNDTEAMQFVSQLKGVRWIVLASQPTTEVIRQWTERFPNASVISRTDWDQLEIKTKHPDIRKWRITSICPLRSSVAQG